MKIDATIRRSQSADRDEPEASIVLALEPLRWGGVFVLPGCADAGVANAAGRAYAWYMGYLLFSNAALIQAQATRAVTEYSRDGDRDFIEIALQDGSGAQVETVTASVPADGTSEGPVEQVSALLRDTGLNILRDYDGAPEQALAVLSDRPFYALPSWLDRALETARRADRLALPLTSTETAEPLRPVVKRAS